MLLTQLALEPGLRVQKYSTLAAAETAIELATIWGRDNLGCHFRKDCWFVFETIGGRTMFEALELRSTRTNRCASWLTRT